YTGDDGGAAYEGEFLRLCEADADGRLRSVVHFEPDDRRAANHELFERGSFDDPSRSPAMVELGRAIRSRDLARIRAALPAEFSFRDPRRLRLGELAPDDYVAWLRSLFDSSPDALVEWERQVAHEPHGTVTLGHTFGTLA